MMLDHNQHIFGPWKFSLDRSGVANVVFEVPDSTANPLSRHAIRTLGEVLDALSSMDHRGIIFSSGTSNFSVGADVHEISSITDLEKKDFIVDGWNVIMRIANWPKPTVAKIHGFCLGGGFELVLACRFRVASDSLSTKFALPEVRLGIFPLWGGVMRLPQLVGAVKAFDLILSGRTVSAKVAKKMGLVDVLAPTRVLDMAADSCFSADPNLAPKRRSLGVINNLLTNTPFRLITLYLVRRQLRSKVMFEHYPTPYLILDFWKRFSGNTLSVPEDDSSSIFHLFSSTTVASLFRVFSLQERLKSYGKNNLIPPVTHVHVVGAGVMGGDVAAWCASKGIKVTLQDLSIQTISSALRRAYVWYTKKLKDPLLVQKAMDLLVPDVHGYGISSADVIFEAVVEDVEVKRKIFSDAESRARPEALLVTNTSSIVIENLAKSPSCSRRIAGLHFFNPVHTMPLVEIVRGDQTDDSIIERLFCFVRQIDKLPLAVKSVPGFLVNRVLGPYILGALNLLESENLSPEAVDDGVRRFGMPMGPVELADYIGLDVCVAAGKSMELSVKGPETLIRLVSEKKLGRKSKVGYYSYDNDLKPIRAKCFSPVDKNVVDRIMKPIYDWTKRCVEEGVVEDEDLADAGMIFGVGFAPFLGGPMFDLKRRGIK
ncbi:3-hydroxyacyl-CoA dehydrogenase NAD-binding domain-containing protein [Candidatus Ichthyocystis hellenicum]|uniref:3-hydroxyacyl-CoA dehydrogenase NAD-binding domain-containing protein n=1 Tax=Candidatus Ichthyocystis hellenicum TaxID=1561003 RepID=UPI000B810B55|nr:3-hydroxyacyl-CoA dehydrogenase NAD-binding domain-containing protein [Candidatus Ichthyocystis hellenicum]